MKIELNKAYKDGKGNKIRIICVDRNPAHYYPVIGLDDDGSIETYTSAGEYDNRSSQNDLVEEWKEPVVHTKWVNIHKNLPGDDVYTCEWGSRSEADHYATPNRIACIQITFKEGEGL